MVARSSNRRSLYTLLGAIIVSVVLFLLSIQAIYSYLSKREEIMLQIDKSAGQSISRLQKNVAAFIEAYAPAEYERLVTTEIELSQHFAIIIHDFHTGEIIGQGSLVSGKIHGPDGRIIDYEADSALHQRWLLNCFHRKKALITADSGEVLGDIEICITDEGLRQALRSILFETLLKFFSVSLLLIVLLFIAIHYTLVRPLSQISAVLKNSDKDGIPLEPIPDYGYREIAVLTERMNIMIQVIRQSRRSLQIEHDSLERSVRINRLILETLPDLLWLKDAEGRYLMCNRRFEEFFGATETEIVGKTDYDFVSKRLADFFREHDQKVIAANRLLINEEWITFASSGHRALMETSKVPLREKDGSITGIMGIAHDITERYTAHQQLLESNAREIALNQSLPIGVLVYGTDMQTINFANESAARILEMEQEQLIGGDLRRTDRPIVDEDGQPLSTWNALKPDAARQHLVLGLLFGERRKWLSINTQPFYVGGKLVGSIVSFTDISKEREMIRALDAEKMRFQLAIEGSQDGLWDWTPETNRVFFSTRWKTMLGYTDDEIGNTLDEWSSRVHPDDLDATVAAVQAHLDGKTPVYENRHRLRCKDGSWKWILDRGKAQFDKDGKAIRVVGFHTDITNEIKHQEELEYSAKHDALTRLPNRFRFNELVQSAMGCSQQEGCLLALLYIDLDGFKAVNDHYGHEAGDAVLVACARRMRAKLRSKDKVARLGGDEFVIAITHLKTRKEIKPLAERLLDSIKQPVHYQDHQLYVSASIGISFYPQEEEIGPEALLRQADQAMYQAKAAGKNQYRLFDLGAQQMIGEHLQSLTQLRRALDEGQFELHYHPKLDMKQGRVLGFEVLLRWNDPQQGQQYPPQFLPLLQNEPELMSRLGRWIFETAFAQLAEWQEQGYELQINLNVSANEFEGRHLYPLLKSLLARYPAIAAQRVELEILETNALEDTKKVIQTIQACQKLGFKVALDDFGTGYSSLGYLRDLPIDTLKLDKSFVIAMLDNRRSFSIVEAAISLTEAFRCNIIAEGVETIEHGVLLRRLGCYIIQGYAVATPMPAKAVLPWLKHYQQPAAWNEARRLHHRKRSIIYAIIEHRYWFKQLLEHLQQPHQAAPPELNAALCSLGRWLNDSAPKLCSEDRLVELRQLHDELHATANGVVQHQSKNRFAHLLHLHRKLLQKINGLLLLCTEEAEAPAAHKVSDFQRSIS